ncbi:MAG: cupin domain-containing protein [Spirochaetia bacterium]|nr:cupin domain-containing protein [Spirochaetia bacterium]
MSQYKILFDNLIWDESVKGMKSKILKKNDKQMRLVILYPEIESKWCEQGHYGYILEGEMELKFENEKILYQKGNGIFIPSGAEHKHKTKILSEFVKIFFVEDI